MVQGHWRNRDGSHQQLVRNFMIQLYCHTFRTHAVRESNTIGIGSGGRREQARRPKDGAGCCSGRAAHSRVDAPTRQRERT